MRISKWWIDIVHVWHPWETQSLKVVGLQLSFFSKRSTTFTQWVEQHGRLADTIYKRIPLVHP